MSEPRVSVVMATYNHAGYVAEAIESVLAQKGVDFEFLIADDGSSDGTTAVLEHFDDPRVDHVAHAANRGAGIVTNELILRTRGEYVALINSDDLWLGEDKLSSQLALLDERPNVAATFGRARFIDKDGRPVSKSGIPFGDVFDQPNRSRGEWMRRFYDHGNCLCHPTMMIRRECYDVLGLYDNRLRQLPDYEMWVRLLKRYDIHVSDRTLIEFRHLPGENASAVTASNSRRAVHEYYLILRRFFEEMPRDVLVEGFGDLLVDPAVPDEIHADIEKALLFHSGTGHAAYIRHLIALEKLHELLGSETHRRVLQQDYAFDDRAFQALTGESGALDGTTNDILERQIDDLNQTLRAVENSISWKLTAPLRGLARAARRR